MLRKLLLIPPLILGVAVLIYIVRNRPEPQRRPAAEEARVVRVMTCAPVRLVPRIRGFGVTRPDRVWSAIAEVGGKVIYVHPRLKKGEIIAEGEEIVTIAPDDYRLAISRAETSIRTAEAKLAELEISAENTRRLLGLEREALKIAQRDYARKKTLKEKGAVPATVLEQASRALIAQRKLVANMENALRLIPTQKKELQEQLATYRIQLATAKLDLARTHIRMPFTGRISLVEVEMRQFAPKGRRLAVADSVRAAEVEAQYPLARVRNMISLVSGRPQNVTLGSEKTAELIRKLRLSVEVRLEDAAAPVIWKGRFARLSDAFDPKTRTMGVIGVVDAPYANVTPGERPPLTKGMFVRMDILARPVEGIIAIPRSALHGDKIFLADKENRLEIRAVTVAARTGNLAIIRKGLKAGERVVLSDLAPALSGQLLRVIPDEDAMRAVAREAAGGAPL